MAGKGKPSKGTPKDMRLKANQPKKAAALKFGSPAWRAKYGKLTPSPAHTKEPRA